MSEFQLSSKYPDGTIAVVKGDDADSVVGQFITFRTAYENESGTAAIKPYVGPTPEVSHGQAVANFQQGLGGQVVSDTSAPPPAPSGWTKNDGDFHPTQKCKDCGQPMKYKIWPTKANPNKKFRKLECSADARNHPQEWVEWVK